MRILAFDTATRATTVALSDDDRAHELRDDPPPGARPNHTACLLALIAELMQRAGVSWGDIDRLAVGVGPGTFTGLRIGIATARGLALARGIPLVPVSTLHSLALTGTAIEHHGSAAQDAGTVLAALDARRGELFAAAWPRTSVARAGPLLEPVAWRPERLAEWMATQAQRLEAVGDGAVEFRTILERAGAIVPADESEVHKVTAIGHCRLAGALSPTDPDEVRPEYLRLPDAEIARRAAGTS